MLISGVQQFTLLDYKGVPAAIVFTPGCNFRCGYCHNSEFVLPEKIEKIENSFIPEEKFFNFLKKRQGLLAGVVISGGEPTVRPDLLDFMQRVKDLGFLIKLDTNGNKPSVIAEAVAEELADYVAMDVKADLESYSNLVGSLGNPYNIKKSINFIMESGVDYEFRSTLVKEFHTTKMLQNMSELIKGAKRYYLQTFRPGNTLEKKFANYNAYSKAELNGIIELFKDKVNETSIRF